MNDTSVLSADPLSEALARWKKTVGTELNGVPFEKKLVTRTFEGVALQPLYTRADLAGIPGLGAGPGEAPFLRGTRAPGNGQRPWEIAQEIAARTPAAFNAALTADLMAGQDSVVFTPAAGGSAAGVAINGLDDLAAALAGVDLTAVPVHLNAGADALPLAALYLALARRCGVASEKLTGSLTADPLGAWAAAGRLGAKPDAFYDSLAGWTLWAAAHAPQLGTIGVDTAIWGDAGATADQELAFALAAAAEYLRELGARKVPVATAAARVRFSFAIGPQFFMEIAKFRALRPLWARVAAAFGVPAEATARASVHAATGRGNKTLLDPQVNMLRVTTEALSAVLGGCDSLGIAPFDAVTGATDDFSRRIARNVHTLLAEEFYFSQVADAAGGSWYVEKLTDELARKAWALFQAIEGRGGFAAALREGHPQKLTAKAAAEKSDALAKRRLGLVGTNLFPNLKEKPLVAATSEIAAPAKKSPAKPPALPTVAATAAWPVRFEAAFAAARSGATPDALAQLSPAAPAAGEIAITAVKPWRASAVFEKLRATSSAIAKRTGARPRVFLAKMGPGAQHKARADFSAGFFAVGGFELLAKQAFDTAEAAASAAAASGAAIAVLCSTDETYPALVPVFAQAVKAAKPGITVVLAGLPADAAVVAAYRAAGVDEFIHVRANVPELLGKFLNQTGAIA